MILIKFSIVEKDTARYVPKFRPMSSVGSFQKAETHDSLDNYFPTQNHLPQGIFTFKNFNQKLI